MNDTDFIDIFEFEDGFFEELEAKIKERGNGKLIYQTNAYFGTSPVLKDELEKRVWFKRCLFRRSLGLKSKNDYYYKDLFDSKNTSRFDLLTYEGYCNVDVITGCRLPTITFSHGSFGGTGESMEFSDYGYNSGDITSSLFFTFEIWASDYYRKKYEKYKNDEVFSLLFENCFNYRMITQEEFDERIRLICNKEAYTKYLFNLFSCLDTVKFNIISEYNPLIPEKLIPFYKKYRAYIDKNKLGLSDSPKAMAFLPESKESDLLVFFSQFISEITAQIEQKPEDERKILCDKLDEIIGKYNTNDILNDSETRQNFKQDIEALKSLVTTSKVDENLTPKINTSLIDRFFSYFYELSLMPLNTESDKTPEEFIDEFLSYVKHFTVSKEGINFKIYFRIHELIVLNSFNLLVLNPSFREKILSELPADYSGDLKIKLKKLLETCQSVFEETNDPLMFKIYPFICEEDINPDYIAKGLSICDDIPPTVIQDIIKKEYDNRINIKR